MLRYWEVNQGPLDHPGSKWPDRIQIQEFKLPVWAFKPEIILPHLAFPIPVLTSLVWDEWFQLELVQPSTDSWWTFALWCHHIVPGLARVTAARYPGQTPGPPTSCLSHLLWGKADACLKQPCLVLVTVDSPIHWTWTAFADGPSTLLGHCFCSRTMLCLEEGKIPLPFIPGSHPSPPLAHGSLV